MICDNEVQTLTFILSKLNRLLHSVFNTIVGYYKFEM